MGRMDRRGGRLGGRLPDSESLRDYRPDQTRPDQTRPDQTRPVRPVQRRSEGRRDGRSNEVSFAGYDPDGQAAFICPKLSHSSSAA